MCLGYQELVNSQCPVRNGHLELSSRPHRLPSYRETSFIPGGTQHEMIPKVLTESTYCRLESLGEKRIQN
jgi:hypothetical protein